MSDATYFHTHHRMTLWLPMELKLAFQGYCGTHGISMNKQLTTLIEELLASEQDVVTVETQEEVSA